MTADDVRIFDGSIEEDGLRIDCVTPVENAIHNRDRPYAARLSKSTVHSGMLPGRAGHHCCAACVFGVYFGQGTRSFLN